MSLNAPGLPGSQVSNDGDIMRMIQDLQRDMRELRAANSFAPMGMTPQANGVVFSGSVEIDGNLSVPNGSISNAALQNPISPSLQSTSVTNFAVPNTATDYATGTIAVPPGFTSAIVDCSGYFGAVNSISGVQYIYVSVVINGVAGHEGIGGNNSASIIWTAATSRKISLLSGLTPGGTISIGLSVRTSDTITWGANTSNRAYCDASALFLR